MFPIALFIDFMSVLGFRDYLTPTIKLLVTIENKEKIDKNYYKFKRWKCHL